MVDDIVDQVINPGMDGGGVLAAPVAPGGPQRMVVLDPVINLPRYPG